jgi:hypothetical protein
VRSFVFCSHLNLGFKLCQQLLPLLGKNNFFRKRKLYHGSDQRWILNTSSKRNKLHLLHAFSNKNEPSMLVHIHTHTVFNVMHLHNWIMLIVHNCLTRWIMFPFIMRLNPFALTYLKCVTIYIHHHITFNV